MPYSLPVAMGFTLVGLVVLARAGSFHVILLAAALVGVGSSVFHPESSRVARMASGGRHGLAQSLFQVGGNAGSALGPLLAAFMVVPHGQSSIAWFTAAALLAIVMLANVGRWYQTNGSELSWPARTAEARPALPRARDAGARHSRHADLLEVLLHRQPEFLLHAVFDPAVSCVHASRRSCILFVFLGRWRSARLPAARSATGSGARW